MPSEKVAGTGLTNTLTDWARQADATVVITRDENGLWSLMSNFGQEAPDSPMAAGSLIGCDESLTECIEQALRDTRINPCATCGWAQTCEEGCHT